MATKEERKAELLRKKKGNLKTKRIRYTLGSQFIQFEKRSFGWHYEGKTVDTVDDGYEAHYNEYTGNVSVSHKTHVIKDAYFTRPACWPKNFLTVLTELLSMFFSFIGRILFNILPILVIVGIIVAAVGAGATMIIAVVAGYAGLYVVRLIFALLGRLWKKVFKLQDRCDEELEKYGYVSWTETEEGEHF